MPARKRFGRSRRLSSYRSRTGTWTLLSILKTAFVISLATGYIAGGVLVLWLATIPIPDFAALGDRKVIQSTKIYDRTGEVVLFDVHEDVKRTVVPFEELSRYLKNATVAIEDAEFYQHIGVRPLAFLRAVIANITTGSFGQGGSTITQQVIKNTILTPEKTISRKLKEWVLAIKLERALSKDEILALYLNEVPYGGNLYGAEEASRAFFGKSAKDITLAEAAHLAALPKAPTYYSPYGNNKDRLIERKNLVLERMRALGFISEEEYAAAMAEEVIFAPPEAFGIKAPHFVMWVREYLEQRYGKEILEQGGLRVVTTLDYALQAKAEEVVSRFAEENSARYNANNAAMVGVDPATGQVLVMVGSRGYFDTEHEGNFNVALARRQPGSAFKPFVYAAAFMRGYTPETVVFDLPTQFETRCDADGNPVVPGTLPNDCYKPTNYDGVYRGPITFREALAQSINIPAIKALYLAGIQNSLAVARSMGITTLTDIDRYGLTLVLGGGEVTLLEMAGAYATFAQDGMRNPVTPILRIEDARGVVLEEFSPRGEQVIPENVARQISSILSDNKARAPAFGETSPLFFPGSDVAAKTGTTNDYRDAWIIGYTKRFALGAWAGNNNNTSMEKKVAGFIVAPMWNAFMQEVLAATPEERFTPPQGESPEALKPILRGVWQGGKEYLVDKLSGKLATEYTPEELRERRVVTDIHSILYWVDKLNPRGDPPQNPRSDPQFTLWETPVRRWVSERGFVEGGSPPTERDDIHVPEAFPRVSFLAPLSPDPVPPDARVSASVQTSGRYPVTRADYFLNGIFLGSSSRTPFLFSFVPEEVGEVATENELSVVVYDSVLNKGSASVPFRVLFSDGG